MCLETNYLWLCGHHYATTLKYCQVYYEGECEGFDQVEEANEANCPSCAADVEEDDDDED
jgi:hypothetical protein